MNNKSDLPSLFSKTFSPKKINNYSPRTSRSINKSFTIAPRSNLFLNSSLNEYDDPIENKREYQKISKIINETKKSMIPLNEELRRLRTFLGIPEDNEQTKNQKQKLVNLNKEKVELENKLSLIRRTYNEQNYVNQQAEIAFLKAKVRKNDVQLTKIERAIDTAKEQRDYFLNSETKAEIILANEKIPKLKHKLSSLHKEGKNLLSEYCNVISSISEGHSEEKQKIGTYKQKLKNIEYELDKKKFELRKMKRENIENINFLRNKVKLKRSQKNNLQQSQNWRQTTKVIFEDDEEYNDENYNPYVTNCPLQNSLYKDVKYKIAFGQNYDKSENKKENKEEINLNQNKENLNEDDDIFEEENKRNDKYNYENENKEEVNNVE